MGEFASFLEDRFTVLRLLVIMNKSRVLARYESNFFRVRLVRRLRGSYVGGSKVSSINNRRWASTPRFSSVGSASTIYLSVDGTEC